jgi:adenylosuccinate synthase
MTDSTNTSESTTVAAPVAEIDPLDALHLEGHTAVCGLQWGDEGKGKIVDLLARRFDVTVRYNGGANAGHTVVVGDQKFALHLVPSGILYSGKGNVVGNGVVVDPAQICKEIKSLRDRGVTVDGDNLRISERAHVVFPYHKVEDVLFDEAVAKACEAGVPIGTTGRGIGPCYADKALRSAAVRMGDLILPDKLRMQVGRAVAIKNATLGALAKLCDVDFEPFDAEALIEEYLGYAEELKDHIGDTTGLLHRSMDEGKQLLFEGANAALLDIDHGTYPFVTSSNCSSLGIYAGSSVPGAKVKNIIGIAKAYQTRVGGGPMPTELLDADGERLRERGHEYGTTTGRPRRCGWIDIVAVKYTSQISGATAISLMLCDVLAGFEKLKICTGYKYKGELLPGFPADSAILAEVEPVYEELDGFAEEIDEAKSYDELPANAKAYVQRIEELVGVPVRIVSVGPRRDQTLVR